MRSPRLKLRALIVLIAVLAGMLAAWIGYERRATRYRLLAMRETELAQRYKRSTIFQSALVQRYRTLNRLREQHFDKLERRGGPFTDDAVVEMLAKRASRKKAKRQRGDDKELSKLISVATKSAERADFHARRSTAFLRAARYPWLSPPADEPEPK